MSEISHMRHKDIFDPLNPQLKITVLGAGSLGSFIAFNLAKLGFEEIKVIDFDIVESHNIPVQLYRSQDINKNKVHALKEIIRDFTNIEIEDINEEVTEKSILMPDINEIFILTFDTLESRKLIFDKLKDFACIVLDVRLGGEEFDIRVVNTSNDVQVNKWEKSFDITPTDLPCGAKSIIYTNFNCAGEVANIVKQINNNESYPTKIMRNMKNYDILGGKK